MSVAELPKYKINPENPLTAEEQSRLLHFEMNAPERPELKGLNKITFPPYKFFPYPMAMYREWQGDDRDMTVFRIAAAQGLDVTHLGQRRIAESQVGEYETVMCGVPDWDDDREIVPELRAKNEREHARFLEQGWADSPAGVKAAKDTRDKAIALAAAHRNYEDRNMSEPAKAEIEAAEAASDQHLAEIPETKRRGRPRKKTPQETH